MNGEPPPDWRLRFFSRGRMHLTSTQWRMAEYQIAKKEGPYYEYVMQHTDHLAPWQLDNLRALRDRLNSEPATE